MRLVRLLVALAACLPTASARAEVFADDFNSAHDYSSKDISGTIWSGVLFNDGFSGPQNTTVVTANASSSNGGRLTLATVNGDWGGTSDDGFFLFRMVSGDFIATVDVTSTNNVNYHDVGLMARAANDADGGPGEDYVAGRYYTPGSADPLRSNDDGVETDFDVAGLHPYLKLERSGNVFTYTRADDSAFTLNVVTSSLTRNDLEGLPLQVGIWQATFSGATGSATFDDFSLTTNIPEPSIGWLGCLGALVLPVLPRRRRSALKNRP